MKDINYHRDPAQKLSQSQVYAQFKWVEKETPQQQQSTGIFGKAKDFLTRMFSQIVQRGGRQPEVEETIEIKPDELEKIQMPKIQIIPKDQQPV